MVEPLQSPRRDPAPLIVLIGVALVAIICAAFLLRTFLAAERPADTPSGVSFADAATRVFERVRASLDDLLGRDGAPGASPPESLPKAGTPGNVVNEPAKGSGEPADPNRVFAIVLPPAGAHVVPVPANGTWVYDVSFGPDWNPGGKLFYQTQPAEQGKVGAQLSWTPSGGSTSKWFLGIVEGNHPTHGYTRFPGFFVHPAYFPPMLRSGDVLQWEIPSFGKTAGARPQLVRRYDMKVAGWERVKVPMGIFDAARLDGTLRYVENGKAVAEVSYTLWYAPRAKQIVRLVWLGRSPDERTDQMIAELSSHTVQ
jgi:hypothetical protein